jgi:tetratricopeptide (TPR) repeat protein
LPAYLFDTLIILALLVTTLLAFSPSLKNGFIDDYDDGLYVVHNRHVLGGLTREGLNWSLTSTVAGHWHPLTWLSLQLDAQIYGPSPTGFHLTALLLHCVNTALLFVALRRMTGARWRSAFVAALFALHPLHVETVAWVADRKDLLSTTFWMLTMLAYVEYARRPGLRRYVLVLVPFALGLAAKSMLVTLPIVLLLLDYWPLGRVGYVQSPKSNVQCQNLDLGRWTWDFGLLRRLLLEKVPLLGLAVLTSWLAVFAQRQAGALVSFDRLPLATRVENALVSYVFYIGKVVWPSDLAAFYPYAPGGLPFWQPVAAALFLAAVTAGALWTAKRLPYLIVGWLWFLGTLVPVSGIGQSGMQAMADRYTYVPAIGLFLMAGWGLADLAKRLRVTDQESGITSQDTSPKRQQVVANPSLALRAGVLPAVLPISCLLILALCIPATWRQVTYWHDPLTLWQHALDSGVASEVAHCSLGSALVGEGRPEEAEEHFQTALSINAHHPQAHYDLGVLYASRGQLAKARQYFQTALEIDPDHAQAHFNMGVLAGAQGNAEEALRHYLEAVRIDPDYAKARNNLGVVLVQQGRVDEAIGHFLVQLRSEPGSARAHHNLGWALSRQGRLREAVYELEQAIRIDPRDAQAHNDLGNVLMIQGKLDQAMAHEREATNLRPDLASAWRNLGIALLLAGQKNEALAALSQAVHLQPNMSEAYFYLAQAQQEKGDSAAAAQSFQKGLSLNPNYAQTANQNAWLLATSPNASSRNGALAVRLARQACEATQYKQADCLDTLAAAYAEAGQFAEAQSAAKRALGLLAGAANADLAMAIKERLGRYQVHQAFRSAE